MRCNFAWKTQEYTHNVPSARLETGEHKFMKEKGLAIHRMYCTIVHIDENSNLATLLCGTEWVLFLLRLHESGCEWAFFAFVKNREEQQQQLQKNIRMKLGKLRISLTVRKWNAFPLFIVFARPTVLRLEGVRKLNGAQSLVEQQLRFCRD